MRTLGFVLLGVNLVGVGLCLHVGRDPMASVIGCAGAALLLFSQRMRS